MSYWEIKRGSKALGHVIADSLRMQEGTLCAFLEGELLGSVASGPDLRWRPISIADTLSERAYREVVGPIKYERPAPANGTVSAQETQRDAKAK